MAWDVPTFSTQGANQGQAIQQGLSQIGAPRQGQQQMQARPVAASSTDMAGNTAATSGTLPQTGQPMFRQGSVLGTFFPDAQSGGSNWAAAAARLMGFGG